MAFPRNDWADGQVPSKDDFNAIANAFRVWQGDVDGGGNKASNIKYIQLVPQALPSSPATGVVACDALGTFKGYNGSSWVTLASGITTPTWNLVDGGSGRPSLLNGWVNLGGPWTTTRYSKDALGIVRLYGSIKNGTITDGTGLLNLPAGYRPATAIGLNVASATAGSGSNTPQVNIDSGTGGVSISGIVSNSYIHIYISFPTW